MQFKKAWKDKSFQQSEAVGWDCLRPAWRGIQDSIDLASSATTMFPIATLPVCCVFSSRKSPLCSAEND